MQNAQTSQGRSWRVNDLDVGLILSFVSVTMNVPRTFTIQDDRIRKAVPWSVVTVHDNFVREGLQGLSLGVRGVVDYCVCEDVIFVREEDGSIYVYIRVCWRVDRQEGRKGVAGEAVLF